MAETRIFAPRIFDGTRLHGAGVVVIDGGHIHRLEDGPRSTGATISLPEDSLLAPGFIDTQVNGGGGVLFNDDPTPEGVAVIAEAHRRFGTTALLPTLVSDSREQMIRAGEAVAAAMAANTPGVIGLHLEGPFLDPARKGVHPVGHLIRPEPTDIDLLGEISSKVPLLVTLAPECVPVGFVGALVERGIRVAAGHTEGPAETILAAADEGLTGVTHLYNAMAQLGSRTPGVVGATLDDDRLYAGIIADGYHVSDIALRVALRAKGPERLMLVTDAMSTVGTDMTRFELFGTEILVSDGRCVTADGVLAGSALDMASAVRNMVRIGASLEESLMMATSTPATFLGLGGSIGTIAPGARADLVALDDDLGVLATWIGGEARWTKQSSTAGAEA